MHRPALPTTLNSVLGDEKENFYPACTNKVGTSIPASLVKYKKVKISRAYKCGI